MSWMIPRPLRDFVGSYFYYSNMPRIAEIPLLGALTIRSESEHLIKTVERTAGVGLLALLTYTNTVNEQLGGLLTTIAAPSVAILYVSGRVAIVGLQHLGAANSTGSLTEAGIGLCYLLGSYVLAENHDVKKLGVYLNKFPGEAVMSLVASSTAPLIMAGHKETLDDAWCRANRGY